MKKKFLSAILCAAMGVTMLAGCGSSGGNGGDSSQSASAKSDDSGEIYMFISQPEYADAIGELIDEYKKVAPNVTINYETTQNDYPTLLKAKLNSGETPDIFSSTSGKEIDTYKEYSYDLTGQPLTETMLDSVAATMQSPSDGNGCYGVAIKGNYFGIVYNKDIFEECGITEFPSTVSAMKDACEKISAKGYQPFTTGFNEWWVFKHIRQYRCRFSVIPDISEISQSAVGKDLTIRLEPVKSIGSVITDGHIPGFKNCFLFGNSNFKRHLLLPEFKTGFSILISLIMFCFHQNIVFCICNKINCNRRNIHRIRTI